MILPSGRTYGFAHDNNGNLTQITMPNGAVHTLGYNKFNLDNSYTPPGNPVYGTQYNLDREWVRTALPSGRAIDGGLSHSSCPIPGGIDVNRAGQAGFNIGAGALTRGGSVQYGLMVSEGFPDAVPAGEDRVLTKRRVAERRAASRTVAGRRSRSSNSTSTSGEPPVPFAQAPSP